MQEDVTEFKRIEMLKCSAAAASALNPSPFNMRNGEKPVQLSVFVQRIFPVVQKGAVGIKIDVVALPQP